MFSLIILLLGVFSLYGLYRIFKNSQKYKNIIKVKEEIDDVKIKQEEKELRKILKEESNKLEEDI